jgi:hypothetical protein
MSKKNTINKENTNEFVDLYYRLYIDCMKYKKEKTGYKEINCGYYYKIYNNTAKS